MRKRKKASILILFSLLVSSAAYKVTDGSPKPNGKTADRESSSAAISEDNFRTKLGTAEMEQEVAAYGKNGKTYSPEEEHAAYKGAQPKVTDDHERLPRKEAQPTPFLLEQGSAAVTRAFDASSNKDNKVSVQGTQPVIEGWERKETPYGKVKRLNGAALEAPSYKGTNFIEPEAYKKGGRGYSANVQDSVFKGLMERVRDQERLAQRGTQPFRAESEQERDPYSRDSGGFRGDKKDSAHKRTFTRVTEDGHRTEKGAKTKSASEKIVAHYDIGSSEIRWPYGTDDLQKDSQKKSRVRKKRRLGPSLTEEEAKSRDTGDEGNKKQTKSGPKLLILIPAICGGLAMIGLLIALLCLCKHCMRKCSKSFKKDPELGECNKPSAKNDLILDINEDEIKIEVENKEDRGSPGPKQNFSASSQPSAVCVELEDTLGKQLSTIVETKESNSTNNSVSCLSDKTAQRSPSLTGVPTLEVTSETENMDCSQAFMRLPPSSSLSSDDETEQGLSTGSPVSLSAIVLIFDQDRESTRSSGILTTQPTTPPGGVESSPPPPSALQGNPEESTRLEATTGLEERYTFAMESSPSSHSALQVKSEESVSQETTAPGLEERDTLAMEFSPSSHSVLPVKSEESLSQETTPFELEEGDKFGMEFSHSWPSVSQGKPEESASLEINPFCHLTRNLSEETETSDSSTECFKTPVAPVDEVVITVEDEEGDELPLDKESCDQDVTLASDENKYSDDQVAHHC